VQSITSDLGLVWRPEAFRGARFYAAVVAGAFFCGVVAFSRYAQPLGMAEMLSLRFLTLAVWWPIWEELIFRGFVQGRLAAAPWAARSWRGVTSANLLTSILFVLAHLFHHPLPLAALTFLPSLLFGYFRDRHASVYPSMALHALYNAGYWSVMGMPG